ncbi:hypothetical protein [Mycolicibacterium houstonense]|uniref:hypothetical protein n=1 Tax=Mycolicibacterium houstonense TaxID=146021 RepID=UPI00082F4636|nr:hypothetical protein [Mycolicibacterium houstonense]
MTSFAVAIPFRDRGKDWRRPANLNRALEHWASLGIYAHVFDDGQTGDAQFNRSACYNAAAQQLRADVIVYAESDLIVSLNQIEQAVEMAAEKPGLVVPFSRFMAMTEADTELVRAHTIAPAEAQAEQVRGEYKSIGAVNVVSRASIEAIGQWPTEFSGAWYDDDACERAFRICCGPTRFVEGNGYHMYHLSGAQGSHLTPEDRAATERNKARYQLYRAAQTPERIRQLTAGGN